MSKDDLLSRARECAEKLRQYRGGDTDWRALMDEAADLLEALTQPMDGEAVEALKLHVAYEAVPADRGGSTGPKGRAWSAFIAARDAALAAQPLPVSDGEG